MLMEVGHFNYPVPAVQFFIGEEAVSEGYEEGGAAADTGEITIDSDAGGGPSESEGEGPVDPGT
jgi:hypothetical protein